MRYTDFPLLFGPVRISMEGEFGSIYDVHFLQSGNVETVGNEVIGDEFLERMAAVLLVNKERESENDDIDGEIVLDGRPNIAALAADFAPAEEHVDLCDDTGDIEEDGAERSDPLRDLLENVVLEIDNAGMDVSILLHK